MPRSLYAKLVVVFIALLCFIGTIVLAIAIHSRRLYEQEVVQRLGRDLAANLVKEDLLLVDGGINEEALEHVFHTLMVINPSIEVYLLDADGRILTCSSPPGRVVRERVALAPIRALLAGQAHLPILGDDPRNAKAQKVFSVSPIMVGERFEGFLYVVLASEEHDSVVPALAGSHILRVSIAGVGGTLMLALLAGLVAFNWLTRRRRCLAPALSAFRRADFAASDPSRWQVPDLGSDEIGQLGAIYNQMAERILQQLTRLKQNDELRRELVAGVSHDLRTPLSSLQGYLETLVIKEGQLDAEERQRQAASRTATASTWAGWSRSCSSWRAWSRRPCAQKSSRLPSASWSRTWCRSCGWVPRRGRSSSPRAWPATCQRWREIWR